MLRITVPKPCHQNWEAMSPNEQGRHCSFCAKTVVDFTGMCDEEVKYFLLNRKEEKVCGRFRNEQLQNSTIHLPENIFAQPLPLWKHFLAACLLAFGMMLFSCNTTTKGEPLVHVKTITIPKDDSGLTVGEPKLPPPPPVCGTVGYVSKIYIEDPVIKGDVEFVPLPPVVQPVEVANAIPVDSVQQKTKDTLQIKNPSKTDSVNCNTKIFY